MTKPDIDRDELRRRWTIELTSLRQRQQPSSAQQGRIRDLQSFLAAIDPLRKYEFDWHSMPGFDQRFVCEIEAQMSVNRNPSYQKELKAKILIALAGMPLPEPGNPGKFEPQAKMVCEDHGEDWNAMREHLIDTRLLRREPNGKLAMSVPGCNFVERMAMAKLKPKGEQAKQALYYRLDEHTLATLLDVKAASRHHPFEEDEPRALPDISRNSTRVRPIPSALPPPTNKHATTQRVLEIRDSIIEMEAKGANAVAILKILADRKLAVPYTSYFKKIESVPFAVWECRIAAIEAPNKDFIGTGPNQKIARGGAAESLLNHLKDLFCNARTT